MDKNAQKIKEYTEEVGRKTRIALVLFAIIWALGGFVFMSAVMIWIWSDGEAGINLPTIFLSIVVLILIIALIRTLKSIFTYKRLIKELVAKDPNTNDKLTRQNLYLKVKNFKITIFLCPVVFVLELLIPMDFSIKLPLLIIVAISFLISLILKLWFQKKLDSMGGITDEEKAEASANDNKNKKTSYIIVVVFAIIGLLVAFILIGSDDKSNSNEKDGFWGSDGKYHNYIPEFGDDVNNWMEENW